ncbi:uncharacterized protein LOC123320538 [Coccinella septempunctata]|uniref:uncharacterized protein LOC123320538 n=1 Tax=Coccinella septempunctata TaxID=41139 RepID=UPI001D07FD53|nr:uncharacterized protein LOC123320538 [Coccinella septempunctata]
MYKRAGQLNVTNILIFVFLSLLLLVFILFAKWYLEVRKKNARIFRILSNYRTPPYLPILGHALRVMGTAQQIHESIVEISNEYGPNYVIWLVHQVMAVIGKPEDLEKVLQSQYCVEKNELYRFTNDVVGTGLFSAPEEKWRKNRKIINPVFRAKILEGYMPIFHENAKRLIDETLPKFAYRKDVDWHLVFTGANVEVIMQTATGPEIDIRAKGSVFGRWMETSMRAIIMRMLQVLYHPDFIFYRTKLGKAMLDSRYKIWEFADEIIADKVRKFKEEVADDSYQPVFEDSYTGPIGKKVFLDFLLELDHKGHKFSLEDLRDEVTTFLVGGTDTSSITAAFFLIMMGMHQDIQEKVYEEVMDVLGPDNFPTTQDLNKLQLMERCLKETMRLFSPAPFIIRRNKKDLKISDGVIPEGANIGINLFYLHRSELYWENPMKFDPDRFTSEEIAKRHPYTYIPFSAGLRGCIGQKYAMNNLKIQMSVTLRKFKAFSDAYKSIEDIELENLMVVRPVHGFKFWLENRESSSKMYKRAGQLNVTNILLLVFLSLLLLVFLLFVNWYLENRRKNARIFRILGNNFRIPPYLPILGHALRFTGTCQQMHESLAECCFEYGPNFVVWLVHQVIAIIGKPEDVEKVLQSQNCVEKNELYRFTNDVVGTGLFSAPEQKWRKNRKIINPVFRATILDGYLPTFCANARRLVEELLPQHVNDKNADWHKVLTSANLEVIMTTAAGHDIDVRTKGSMFGQWMETSMRQIVIRMVQVLYHPDFIFFKTKYGKTLHENKLKIWEFADGIIADKRQKFKEELANNTYQPVFEDSYTGPIGKKVFLDFLLELDHKGHKFSNVDLRDELTTFLVGGTDTSSISAAFFLTMMGMHPDIQEKVYEEVMTVLGPNDYPTTQDLNNLQYVERCLKETMRLFSPAPILLRRNKKDLKISDGVIPEGADIGINCFYLHRSELYWKDPLKFDPDRFSSEEIAKRHPYTFIPFSAGLRGCIGYRYALMMMKVILSKIVRKFKFKTGYKSIEEIQLKINLMMRPTYGFKVTLEPRE